MEREVYPSLTGLRFVLAAWITIYHLISMYGSTELAESPFIAVGNARVDIFFVLSGFVLAHVYAVRRQAQERGFDYARFLVARAARLYPLHLLALFVLGVAVAAALVLGRTQEAGQFTAIGLLANLFMLQATVIPEAASWNFPAWTLSAEAFGYLLFPIFIAAGVWMRGRGLAFWGLAVLVVGCVGAVWPLLGNGPLSEATQILGIARGACCMFVGVAARHAFEDTPTTALQAVLIALSGALVAGTAAIQGYDLWMVALGASALIFGVAGIDRAGVATPLAHPTMEMLGRWSYGMFILHVPLFIIMTRGMQILGWDGVLTLPIAAFMLAVVLAVSWPAHRLVEEPMRQWIRSSYDRAVRKKSAGPDAAAQ